MYKKNGKIRSVTSHFEVKTVKKSGLTNESPDFDSKTHNHLKIIVKSITNTLFFLYKKNVTVNCDIYQIHTANIHYLF